MEVMPLTVSLDTTCHFLPSLLIFLYVRTTTSRLGHECHKDAEMKSRGGLEFISTLTRLLDRLFDFRSVAGGGGEEGRDLKMHVMFNLLVSALRVPCGYA